MVTIAEDGEGGEGFISQKEEYDCLAGAFPDDKLLFELLLCVN